MKKLTLGLGITLLMLMLLASAFAFSLTLQNLRVSAFSFAQPAEAAAVISAPMTSNDEANISSPSTQNVRIEEFTPQQHVCQKDRTQDPETDF